MKTKKEYLDSRGMPVPRTTEILGCWQARLDSLLCWAADHGSRRAFLANRYRAARAGTQVHSWIEQTLDGKSQLSDFDPRLDPEQRLWAYRAYESFKVWGEVYLSRLCTVRCEVELVSDMYGYGGTCDLVAELSDGRLIIADWKTSRFLSAAHIAQLAAYSRGYEERYQRSIDEAWLVRFSRDERAYEHRAISRVELDLGWHFFAGCLASYNAHQHLRSLSGLHH